MGLPPNIAQYLAQKHLEAAEKHLSGVYERMLSESQEDRRALEKFYNNLALFSGGTIALSITIFGSLYHCGDFCGDPLCSCNNFGATQDTAQAQAISETAKAGAARIKA